MSRGPRSPVPVWNIANALTAGRIVLVPVFLVVLFQDGGHAPGWRWIAAVVFAIASVTDQLDGYLARSRGIVTDIGKIADPIADKALTGAALIGLSVLGDIPWWITIVILVREIGITALRLAVLSRVVIAASMGGKVKTVLLIAAILLYLQPGWFTSPQLEALAMAVLVLAVAVTVVTGVNYLAAARKAVTEPPEPDVTDPTEPGGGETYEHHADGTVTVTRRDDQDEDHGADRL